jgi:hypothetical protein
MNEQRSLVTHRIEYTWAVGERYELSVRGVERSNLPGAPATSWPTPARWLNLSPHLVGTGGEGGLHWQVEALAAGDAVVIADVDSERLEVREVEEVAVLWAGADSRAQWGSHGSRRRDATATTRRPVEVRVPVTLRMEFRIKIIDPTENRRADFLEPEIRRV